MHPFQPYSTLSPTQPPIDPSQYSTVPPNLFNTLQHTPKLDCEEDIDLENLQCTFQQNTPSKQYMNTTPYQSPFGIPSFDNRLYA